MTNQQYLYISYFIVLVLGLAAAVVVIWLLNKPLHQALAQAKSSKLSAILKRAFPTWLLLAVLLGFASVSYKSCSHDTYEKIIADHDYLVSKNQEQVSAMSQYLAVALMAVGFILLFSVWATVRNSPPSPPTNQEDHK